MMRCRDFVDTKIWLSHWHLRWKKSRSIRFVGIKNFVVRKRWVFLSFYAKHYHDSEFVDALRPPREEVTQETWCLRVVFVHIKKFWRGGGRERLLGFLENGEDVGTSLKVWQNRLGQEEQYRI